MKTLRSEVTAIIDATPRTVYAIIANYRDKEKGHPAILPPKNFQNLVIEEGGQGAGTVFSVHTVMGGAKQALRMRVSEPEPGRVIVENDQQVELTTTFTFEPHQNGQQTRFTIATVWKAHPGIMGLLESMLAPGILRKVYLEEMQNLKRLVHTNTEANVY